MAVARLHPSARVALASATSFCGGCSVRNGGRPLCWVHWRASGQDGDPVAKERCFERAAKRSCGFGGCVEYTGQSVPKGDRSKVTVLPRPPKEAAFPFGPKPNPCCEGISTLTVDMCAINRLQLNKHRNSPISP